MELETRGCYLLLFKTIFVLSNVENKNSKNDKLMLRLLTPLLKLFTAKYSIKNISEGIEAIGALAYMEDSHIPYLLRDSQVLSIWEGTTNILVLDFLKVI